MNDLLSIFKETKIDFSKVSIHNNSERVSMNYFDIIPTDFIKYAKEDFKNNDKKGFVNSLTNSKRAIDCQIDTILNNYGISFDNIPKASKKIIESIKPNNNLPHKLKLIHSLKFSPSELITKTRSLRNKLEHYYQIPTEKEIKESIEIAELFILSCKSKTKWLENDFIITNESYGYSYPHVSKEKLRIDYLQIKLYENFVSINFDYKKKQFVITPTIAKKEHPSILFNQTNPEFYFLIRIINSLDFKIDLLESLVLLLKYINHPIPERNIKIDKI